MAALPDLTQSAAMSMVMLGRLSYMTPITPSGTLRLDVCRPFGRVRSSKTSTSGSGWDSTPRTPAAYVPRGAPRRGRGGRGRSRLRRSLLRQRSPSGWRSGLRPGAPSGLRQCGRGRRPSAHRTRRASLLDASRAAIPIAFRSVAVWIVTSAPYCCGGPPRHPGGSPSSLSLWSGGPLSEPDRRRRSW